MGRFKNCQSCGMPLRRDERGGGTNADQSLSGEYCSHCFQDGRFTRSDLTPAEMQRLVASKLKDSGVPAPFAWLLTRRIPKLRRWKSEFRA